MCRIEDYPFDERTVDFVRVNKDDDVVWSINPASYHASVARLHTYTGLCFCSVWVLIYFVVVVDCPFDFTIREGDFIDVDTQDGFDEVTLPHPRDRWLTARGLSSFPPTASLCSVCSLCLRLTSLSLHTQ